jgi:hypothetical protein
MLIRPSQQLHMPANYVAPVWGNPAGVDGPALSNTTTATSLLHASMKFQLGAGFFSAKGYRLRLDMHGRMSTVVTSPGTFQFFVRLGSVDVFSGGTMTLSTTAKTNVNWAASITLTMRGEPGASATLFGTGWFKSEAAGATTVAGEAKSIMMPQSSPAVGSSFDSMAAQLLEVFGQWSTANASNSIQVHGFNPIDEGIRIAA